MKKIAIISLFCAFLCAVADAQVWQLSLAGAAKGAKGDQALTLNVATQNGKGARGIVQGFNSALHDVDVTGVKAEGRTLKGVVKITLNADNWLPADKKPVACEYTLEATAAEGGSVIGNQNGKFGATDVSGAVTGKLVDEPAEIKAAKIEFRMENALNSQKNFLRTAVITFTWRDGKVLEPKIGWVRPDKFHWTGKIESNDLKLTPAGLTGTVTADVATGTLGEVEPGKYVFTVDGAVAGNLVAGKFKAKLGEKDLTGGSFVGTLK